MKLSEVTLILNQAFFVHLPMHWDTPEARVEMLSIGQQESRFEYRRQMNNGPAMGFWQFERGGGVRGVLRHPSTKVLAAEICTNLGVVPEERAVWVALQDNDVLAACFARMLLWTDPKPLPKVSDADGAWDLYLRTWRPGKPHRDTWDNFHALAVSEVTQ